MIQWGKKPGSGFQKRRQLKKPGFCFLNWLFGESKDPGFVR
jgi:hypothetical protein